MRELPEPYGIPMSERAAELSADPVRGPRIAALRGKLAQQSDTEKPFGYWHVGRTEEESDFFLHSESGDVSCENCVKLFTRDQVLAIQKQAYEDGLRDAMQACGELYETFQKQHPSDYDRGYLDGIERAEIHIESLTEDPLKEPQ